MRSLASKIAKHLLLDPFESPAGRPWPRYRPDFPDGIFHDGFDIQCFRRPHRNPGYPAVPVDVIKRVEDCHQPDFPCDDAGDSFNLFNRLTGSCGAGGCQHDECFRSGSSFGIEDPHRGTWSLIYDFLRGHERRIIGRAQLRRHTHAENRIGMFRSCPELLKVLGRRWCRGRWRFRRTSQLQVEIVKLTACAVNERFPVYRDLHACHMQIVLGNQTGRQGSRRICDDRNSGISITRKDSHIFDHVRRLSGCGPTGRGLKRLHGSSTGAFF